MVKAARRERTCESAPRLRTTEGRNHPGTIGLQRSVVVLLGWLAACGWGSVLSAPTVPPFLTFEQVWRAALEQTPEVLAARARVAEAQGALKTAQGHLLPKLQGSFAASGSNNALNVFGMKLNQGKATFNDFGAGDFNPAEPSSLFIAPSNLNNPGWYQNYQSKLELQIPLYNGGKLWGYLRQSEALLRAARQGDEAARQRLVLQVLKAYEGLRAAQAFVAVAWKGETAAKSNLELTDKLYAGGVVSRNDQLRAQLSLGDAQLRRSEAQANLAKAQEQLRVLIGTPPQRPLQVSRTVRVSLPDVSLAVLQRQALAGNPSLRALEERLQAAHVGVNIARSDYLPHFNVVLSEEWNSESIGGGGKPSSTVAGVLSWDLLDFGVRRGSLDRASAKVIEQKAQLRQAQDKLRVELDAAWHDVKLAAERVKVRRLAIKQAEEAERLERLRYQKGLATMSDLLGAQAELDKARSELVAAHYQEAMKRAGLLLGLGRLTPQAVVSR